MSALRWLLLIALAACGRTGLLVPSDDDVVVPAAGHAGRTGGTGGGDGARGGVGFVQGGGTTASGGGGIAGSELTRAGNGGGEIAGSAPTRAGSGGAESGFGGEAGAPEDPQCVVRVSQTGGSDANDGSSWGRAVASLSRALELVPNGCEIWLTDGTYRPAGSDRNATFLVPDGVTIRGQFLGNELRSTDRLFIGPLPALSGNLGDPTSSDDDAYTVVTTGGTATLDHVAVIEGHTAGPSVPGKTAGGAIFATGALTLDGCTISSSLSEGDAAGLFALGPLTIENSAFVGNAAARNGGAILYYGGGPLFIDHSSFRDNVANEGAAIYVTGSSSVVSVTIRSSTFDANVAHASGGAVLAEVEVSLDISGSEFDSNQAAAGAAVSSAGPLSLANVSVESNVAGTGAGIVTGAAATSVTQCDFDDNQGSALFVNSIALGDACSLTVAQSSFTMNTNERGAGIEAIDCSASVDGSSFTDNHVTSSGGAIDSEGGGTELKVTGSTFQSNSAELGGAVYAVNGLALTWSSFYQNSAAVGGAVLADGGDAIGASACIFMQNDATSDGGALDLGNAPATLVNTLIAGNTARYTGAALRYSADDPSQLRLTNVTAAGNVSTGPALQIDGPILVENSIIWNPTELALSSGTLTSEDANAQNLFASNLSGTYPSLATFDPQFVPGDANFHLAAGSPCIDHADDSRAPPTDLDGNPRLNEHASTPCPSCTGIADMGAYEYGY